MAIIFLRQQNFHPAWSRFEMNFLKNYFLNLCQWRCFALGLFQIYSVVLPCTFSATYLGLWFCSSEICLSEFQLTSALFQYNSVVNELQHVVLVVIAFDFVEFRWVGREKRILDNDVASGQERGWMAPVLWNQFRVAFALLPVVICVAL